MRLLATSSDPTAAARRRWPFAGPGQRPLAFATLLVIVGSFLPWVDTAFGTLSGFAGAGVWTFYAGVLGVPGSLLRSRGIVLAHALVVAAVALTLPLWQVGYLLSLGLDGGWMPGVGLVMVLLGGVTAAWAAWRLFLDR